MKTLHTITRFEVIDHREGSMTPGRCYSALDCRVEVSRQDGGRTLKVFVFDRGERRSMPADAIEAERLEIRRAILKEMLPQNEQSPEHVEAQNHGLRMALLVIDNRRIRDRILNSTPAAADGTKP